MGVQDLLNSSKGADSAAFLKALLVDVQVLEEMLDRNLLERGVVRVGVEQEMFLVDRAYRPAAIAPQVLADLSDSAFCAEIGKFNLEANLAPRKIEGVCLRSIEAELAAVVERASLAAQTCGGDVLLTGILPSVRISDLSLTNLTERPRYEELNRAVMAVRGGSYHLFIKGVDELQLTHDNVMPEACCTSFQVHMQLDQQTFASDYNASLLAAAPVLSVAANSPMLLGRRLWQETRIALFQHAVDERSHSHIARSHPTRVSFGQAWVEHSVLEIYREQIARFRSIMTTCVNEDSLETLHAGRIPSLKALVLHNGTVWRWNRPCFGITEGRPHLRVEFRALPAGPTIIDEVANAALFLGLVRCIPREYGDISKMVEFDDAKDNFFAAARHGLKAQLTWINGRHYSVHDLLRDQLLPLASGGLKDLGINSEDVDRYLGIIRERLDADQTGSKWLLSATSSASQEVSGEGRDRRLVAALLRRQKEGQPVHKWGTLSKEEIQSTGDLRDTVGEIMSTDLFTVAAADPVSLAASLMDWRHIRHLPVEQDGRLVGLISSREIFHFMAGAAATSPDAKAASVGNS